MQLQSVLMFCWTASYLSSDGTTQLADESELMLLSVPLHYGTPGPHFRHDAACSPQVDGGAIVSLTFEKIYDMEINIESRCMSLPVCSVRSFVVASHPAAALEACTRV